MVSEARASFSAQDSLIVSTAILCGEGFLVTQAFNDLVEQLSQEFDAIGVPSNHTHRRAAQRLSVATSSDLISLVPGTLEHTLLRPESTPGEVESLCEAARVHRLRAVCVHPIHVRHAATTLQDTDCLVVSVVGFPHGAHRTETKAFEARLAISPEEKEPGANELDMVIALGALKARDYLAVYQDIESVVRAAAGHPVKVIIETSVLDLQEKIAACLLSARAGAAYLKTSTGFGSGGATIDDVRLMRAVLPDEIGIKAAGGIKNLKTAIAMLRGGADRIGSSSGAKIAMEARACGRGKVVRG